MRYKSSVRGFSMAFSCLFLLVAGPRMLNRLSKYRTLLAVILMPIGTSWAQPTDAIGESDVITLTLRRNLGIQASAYDPQIAATEITKAKSQYDTRLSGQAAFNL